MISGGEPREVDDATAMAPRVAGVDRDGCGLRVAGTSARRRCIAVLAGAIETAELQNNVIPAMAALLNQVLQDPTTSQPVKDTILTLFDANQDGVITVAEVMDNSIIKTFLDGDVDVDNDGMNELSMGLGFKAVGAVITP